MSDLIKKIKIKKQDGTYTDYIPIGAEAKNVDCSDGESVEYKLNKKPYYYNSVADMKADTSLKVGDMAITLGYYEPNDGGGAEYRIVKTSDNYVEDLENSLKAELVIKDEINIKQFGAYGDGIHKDTEKIQIALDKGINKTIFFPYGIYLTESLVLNGKTILYSDNATLKAASSINYILYSNVDFTIKNIKFDADNKATNSLKTDGFNYKIHNCYFINSIGEGISSRGIANKDDYASVEDCIFDTAGGGIFITGAAYQNPDDYQGTVVFKNCRTINNCGTNTSIRLYMFQKLNYVNVIGGDFTGNPANATNIYQTNHVEVNGGYYHDINRGVTLGLITKNAIVVNTINENINGGGGLHIDLVTSERVHPMGHSIIANNIVKNAFRGMFIQGKNMTINNNYIYCGTNTTNDGGIIRFNDDNDNTVESKLFLDNLFVYNAEGFNRIINTGTAIVYIGNNIFVDGTTVTYNSIAGNESQLKTKKIVTDNTYLNPFDDLILVDASEKTIQIFLPSLNECNLIGKEYIFIRTDSSAHSVFLRCRNDNGTIDGIESGSGVHSISKGVERIIQISSGTYYSDKI